MRSMLTLSIILALAAPAVASACAEAAAGRQDLEWKTDYKAALELAKEDGRPVVVHFWADG